MPDQIKYNDPLNLDNADNKEYEFKFDNANMGVAPPPLVGYEKPDKHQKHNFYQNVVVANGVNIQPNVVQKWYDQVVGHDVPEENDDGYPDNGADDELIADKVLADCKPYAGILQQEKNYNKIEVVKYKQGNPVQYIDPDYGEKDMPQAHPCDPYDKCYYPAKENNIKGMMVFYINTNGMSVDQAMVLLEKVSKRYENIENKLKNSGVEVMWLPANAGNTSANYFNF